MDARRAEDLLAVRSAGRAIAARLGVDETDQIRLATALSEIGRDVLAIGADNEVVFCVADEPVPAIVVRFVVGAPGGHLSSSPGVAAARRLVDDVHLLHGNATTAVERGRSRRGPRTGLSAWCSTASVPAP